MIVLEAENPPFEKARRVGHPSRVLPLKGCATAVKNNVGWG